LQLAVGVIQPASITGDKSAKRLRFWSRLHRAPTPLRAHSQEPVGRPDSA
jgi:hypothetical protein